MAPCLVKHQGNLKYIVGSSGSERIRSALVSVLLGLLEDGLSLQEAVEKGRIHYDGSKAHLEDESDETLQEITEIPLAFWDAS